MTTEAYSLALAQERNDYPEDLAERQLDAAWNDLIDALDITTPSDLRAAAECLRHIGRALQAERNGEPFDYYQTALNDAAAVIRETHVDTRPGRITRIRTLADAIEAKELAQ